MVTQRVLVVEDEPATRLMISRILAGCGWKVEAAGSLGEAVDALDRFRPDLVVLDLLLPDASGVAAVHRLRATTAAPILVVSGITGPSDKVAALDAGADDYMTKPFDADELVARGRATTRRVRQPHHALDTLRYDALEIDLRRRRVLLHGRPLVLTPVQYTLLEALAANPGVLLRRPWLIRQVWGDPEAVEGRRLEAYVEELVEHLSKELPYREIILCEGDQAELGYRWLPEPSPDVVRESGFA